MTNAQVKHEIAKREMLLNRTNAALVVEDNKKEIKRLTILAEQHRTAINDLQTQLS